MAKTLTFELVVSHLNRPYNDTDHEGKPIEGRKVLSLIAAPGELPQTTHLLIGDADFLEAAAVGGTPATLTITLGDPPREAEAHEPAPGEHV